MSAYRPRSRRSFLARIFGRAELRTSSLLLSASVFEAAFRREKALAARTKRQFSLVVLIPAPSQPNEPDVVARALADRLRESDVMGYLAEGQIAVLLPETNEQGAHTFVDSILTALAAANLQFDYDLFCYPRRCDVDDEGGRGREGRLSASSPSSNGFTVAELRGTPELTILNGVGSGVASACWALSGPGAVTENESTIEADGNLLRVKASSLHAPSVPAVSPQPIQRDLELREIRALVGRPPARDMDELFLKPVSVSRRLVDISVSGTLLVLLMPLFAVVGLLVKVSSPGSVLYSQKRAGLGGRPFRFYKFRSMHVDADSRRCDLQAENEKDGPIFKIRNDPRITPIGRLIRKASIDELPQLFNVLVGDMTLIGPRPATLDEVEQYEPWQRERLALPGGLTCIWQVSGRSEVEFVDWMRMDLRYAREKSMLLDISLLVRTVGAVFTGRGAY